jgi:large subunit ribosomal protein L32
MYDRPIPVGPAGPARAPFEEHVVAVPKRRMSRSNTRSRRAQWKARAVTLTACDRCRSPKLPHTACPTCGTYDRRQILDV